MKSIGAPAELQSAIVRNPLMVSPEQTVLEAIAQMSAVRTVSASTQMSSHPVDDRHCAARSSCVLVVDHERLLGILTEQDVVRLSTQQCPLASLAIGEVMTSPVVTLRESAFTDRSLTMNLLQQQRIQHLPVLDDGDRIVGLLTLTELLVQQAAQLEAEKEHLLNHYTAEVERQVEWRMTEIKTSLQASEQRYATLTEMSPVGIFQTNAEGHCLYVNERWSQIAGLSSEQAAGPGWVNGIHPDDRQSVSSEWYTAAQMNRPFRLEYRFQNVAGDITWVLGQATAERRGTGAIVGYVGAITDITERKQAEAERWQAEQLRLELKSPLHGNLIHASARDITSPKQAEEQLRKSDAHLRTAQRIGKLGSWEFTPSTQEIIWSDEVFRIFGHDVEGGPPTFDELQQQIHLDDRDHHQQVLTTAIERVQPYEIEYRFYRPDGTLRYIQARGEPIVDAAGQMIQLVGTVLDITERKQAEEQLRNLSDRLALAVESGAIGIWDWNVAENILTWDDRMYELYGIKPDQFTSMYDAWASSLHPDDRSYAEAAIQQALRGEKDYNPEFRVVHADGTIRFIKAYALVQRNNQGDPQHMIGINFDITEQKLAELKLLQTTAQLEASNRELEAFAYSVSHDLRAPLRTIDGFSKALMEDYEEQLDDEAKDYFNCIRAGVHRMGTLIDDLLRLSRVSRSEMQYRLVNLSDLVQHIAADLQKSDPERQVEFRIVPKAIVYADANLMRVVLENLLQNAWKFSSHHATAHIEFGITQRQEQPTYFVRDDGAGFDMAFASLLFGVFQRLHNTDEFPGTGIGLATVQRVIHRHGGQVWAEGAIEQGATLYFTLPNTTLSN